MVLFLSEPSILLAMGITAGKYLNLVAYAYQIAAIFGKVRLKIPPRQLHCRFQFTR